MKEEKLSYDLLDATKLKKLSRIKNADYHISLDIITEMIETKIDKIPDSYYKGFKGFFNKRHIKSIRKQIQISKDWMIKSKNAKTKLDHACIVKTSVNLLRHNNLLDISGWKKELKDKYNPDKTFLINMQLRNGMHTRFLVVLGDKYFEYEDGRYIIDDDYKYYDVGSRIYNLDYHQDCCLPLKRKFNMREIEKAVSSSKDVDTETSINPKSLRIFMESDIIQKVIAGEEAEKHMKFVKFMLIIIAGGVTVTLAILIKLAFG